MIEVGEELRRCGKCEFFDDERERCLNYNMKVTKTSLVRCDAYQPATEKKRIQKPVPLPETYKPITAAPSFLSILTETKPIEEPIQQQTTAKVSPPIVQYEDKTGKLNQIVRDSNEVIKIILTLTEHFETEWIIGEVIFLLKEIKTKIAIKFPGLFVIEKLDAWIDKLDAKYGDGSIIPERTIMDLEFQILDWVFEINKTSFNNIDLYLQIFPEMKDQIQVLYNLLEENFPIFTDMEKRYLKLILNYLIVTEKASGLTLYTYNFTPSEVDSALFSGFLNAIHNFGSEIYSEKTEMTRLSYKTFEISLDDEEAIIVALILRGNPTENTTQRLRIFTKEFAKTFQKEILLWAGNAKLFKPADDLIRKIFS